MIEIQRTADADPLAFDVVVREGKGETRHHVTMSLRSITDAELNAEIDAKTNEEHPEGD